ncbi:hypothetical protein L1987_06692 [Smallanthus sonchifolius]|uniref:Uncharacterized protein n=1 Tax=Smallanthus sonchifolius TaxID=185202 RepID=A0ACB9JZ85_9ASTR|nr:hypothetical protein L1987_06692 [Smallanthus sonchifolius]
MGVKDCPKPPDPPSWSSLEAKAVIEGPDPPSWSSLEAKAVIGGPGQSREYRERPLDDVFVFPSAYSAIPDFHPVV